MKTLTQAEALMAVAAICFLIIITNLLSSAANHELKERVKKLEQRIHAPEASKEGA